MACSALKPFHLPSFQSQHHPRALLRPSLCSEEEDCQQAVSFVGDDAGGAGARGPRNPTTPSPGHAFLAGRHPLPPPITSS